MMNRHTGKAADGGPTSEQTAARAIGGATRAVRGGTLEDAERRARGGRYEVTKARSDGLPLPPTAAPDAHGGHYFTVEDREKYDYAIGYDGGLATGYDPTFEKNGMGDERGKMELRTWTPGEGHEPRVVRINRNHNDGAQAMAAVYAVDPSGNVVSLAPNTLTLKAGWKWAAMDDLKKASSTEEDRKREEERRRQEQEKNPPAPAPQPAPPVPQESAEQRKAREDANPILQAERNGASKSDAEKMVETQKAAGAAADAPKAAHHDATKDRK